jgi:hypothetical protein
MESKRPQIIYEPEDAYAADAFKKYLFLSQEASKGQQAAVTSSRAGVHMRNMIDTSDYYAKNFKPSRDSELEDKGANPVDITKLRSQRRAVINPIHSDDAASIQVIKIGKKTRLGVTRANDGGQ